MDIESNCSRNEQNSLSDKISEEEVKLKTNGTLNMMKKKSVGKVKEKNLTYGPVKCPTCNIANFDKKKQILLIY